MNEEIDARTKLHSEDHEQPGGRREMPPLPASCRTASNKRSRRRGAKKHADHTDHHRRISHMGSRHQAEQRDGQGIAKREKRSRSPDLVENVWEGVRGAALRDGHDNEQEAREGSRRGRDCREQIPVVASQHNPHGNRKTGVARKAKARKTSGGCRWRWRAASRHRSAAGGVARARRCFELRQTGSRRRCAGPGQHRTKRRRAQCSRRSRSLHSASIAA